MNNSETKADPGIYCPLCNGKLSYGLEETIMHIKVIDPKTGALQKKTVKKRVMNSDDRSFLVCQNQDCDFIADDFDTGLFKKYFPIFGMIKKEDIAAFAKSLEC